MIAVLSRLIPISGIALYLLLDCLLGGSAAQPHRKDHR